jgi:hypothetical protein
MAAGNNEKSTPKRMWQSVRSMQVINPPTSSTLPAESIRMDSPAGTARGTRAKSYSTNRTGCSSSATSLRPSTIASTCSRRFGTSTRPGCYPAADRVVLVAGKVVPGTGAQQDKHLLQRSRGLALGQSAIFGGPRRVVDVLDQLAANKIVR